MKYITITVTNVFCLFLGGGRADRPLAHNPGRPGHKAPVPSRRRNKSGLDSFMHIKSVSKVLGKIPKPAAPTLQEDLSQDL